MKYVITILALTLSSFVIAQSNKIDATYSQSVSFEGKDITVYIQVTLPALKTYKNSPPLFIVSLNHQNDSTLNLNRSAGSFIDSGVACMLVSVKPDFSSYTDTMNYALLSEFSKTLFSYILPAIEKKYSRYIPKGKIFLSGINEGAFISLAAAESLPQKVASVALLTESFIVPQELISLDDNYFKKFRGKIFFYDCCNDTDNPQIDILADKIALHSKVSVYKVDRSELVEPENPFGEFLKWFNADGNNFIIRTN